MAYAAHPADFHGATPHRRAPQAPVRRGFWRGLYDAIANAQQRAAEREIARHVARRGKLTDSIEREIADRMLGRSGGWF